MTEPCPTTGIDDTVHQRHRLGILTIAAEADTVEFAYLQDALVLTSGNLSRHLAVLEGAKLVSIHKGFHGRRPKTWIKITKQGRHALDEEVAILIRVVQRHQATPPSARSARSAAIDVPLPNS